MTAVMRLYHGASCIRQMHVVNGANGMPIETRQRKYAAALNYILYHVFRVGDVELVTPR